MVRVRYQPRTHAEDRQRVDFEMGVPAAAAAAAAAIATAAAYSAHARQELRLVHRDLGGIFLVHVEVLDDPLTDEIVPRPRPRAKLGHVLRGELRAARVAHDYEWPADTPRVGSDVDAAVNRMELDGNELAQPAGAAQLARLFAQGWFHAVIVFFWFWHDPKPNVAEMLLPSLHAYSPHSRRPFVAILSDDAHALRDPQPALGAAERLHVARLERKVLGRLVAQERRHLLDQRVKVLWARRRLAHLRDLVHDQRVPALVYVRRHRRHVSRATNECQGSLRNENCTASQGRKSAEQPRTTLASTSRSR